MSVLTLNSYAAGRWTPPGAQTQEMRSAVTGDVVAIGGKGGLDVGAMADYARKKGGPALRKLTFHERARMLKALADALMAKKEELYELSFNTGATRNDSWIDIEGGAGTLYAYSSKGRRELPNDRLLADGALEGLSKSGAFAGQHVFTSLHGVAVHINAFNFPVWGMLEKLSVSLLAGVPAIVKPASATAYLTEAAFRIMIESGAAPEGALQLVIGPTGDLFDHLTCQDVVSFTGSADTAVGLAAHPVIARESVRFIAERDSLNASVLGPDATPDSPEFALFVKEVAKEMSVKAGQKCTAIRRAFVPAALIDAAEAALKERLAKIVVGDPRAEGVTMGALVSLAQRQDVRAKAAELARKAKLVFGDPERVDARGADGEKGAFLSPLLFRADDPWAADAAHDVEPFGPVSTLMPYKDFDDAMALVNRGKGSLVMSLFTYDADIAREAVLNAGAFHGRMVLIDRDCAKDSTGHGSPMPAMTHGGPGRAGGGEEMGGVRGLAHYMQRTAVQGGPRTLSHIVQSWLPGAPQTQATTHPFRLKMRDLHLGYTLNTAPRTISLEDIEHFAHFTGDTFYAHMDEEAARANPLFGGRVAHGYLILSFAAGLFVDPAPGPVLANYGLDNLRFIKPVKPGDTLKVALTVKEKTLRDPTKGEVRWAVRATNQNDELVAVYELLTMNEA